MAKDAILNIIFGANTKELDKALDGATKRLRDTASQMNDVGKSLSIGLTAPIVAFGALATKNAVDSAKAIAQVEAAVKSTGGAAGRSVSQLEEMATGLQRISLYDDDQILKEVTANLLTFTNVTGTEFDKAQVAILNMSTRLGTDLTSASVQVGKALNDPIKGVTALGRAGVQFTAQQKEQIAALTESGDVAGAQAIILGELETQFGGASQAAANTDPYTQLSNEVGNLSEDFGKIINEALLPLVGYIRRAVDAIKGWSTETKTTVLVIGGLLAVLGPTLVAVGSLINAYTTIKGALIAAKAAQIQMNLATLANPYVLAAAAVGVLVGALLTYKDSADQAREAKEDFDKSIEGKGPRQAMDAIAQQMSDTNAQLADARRKYAELQRTQELQGARVSDRTISQLSDTAELIRVLEDQSLEYQRQYRAASKLEQQRIKDSKTLSDNTEVSRQNTTATKVAAVEQKTYNDTLREQLLLASATLQVTGDQAAYVESLAHAYRDAAVQAKLAGENARSAELAGLATGGGQLTRRGPSQIPIPALDAPRGLMTPQAPTWLQGMVDGADMKAARENLLSIQQILDNLGSSMAQVGEQFGAALGGIITGAEGAAEAMKGVARAAIDAAFNAATALAIQAAGQTAVGSGPAAAIVLPALITAGMALVKSVFTNLVGLATGGLTTGPMLAMIGDNPSGKEAVIPFERMGEFLDMAGANQPSNVTVTGRISGRDIMLSNERSSRDRKRIR